MRGTQDYMDTENMKEEADVQIQEEMVQKLPFSGPPNLMLT
tara:strand:+ start:585 stop:707 length:123 start_codon:yes stop_codon:yes gene_type:complete